MSATDETKIAGAAAADDGQPAAEGHGHATHGEGHSTGEGHTQGDGHTCCDSDHCSSEGLGHGGAEGHGQGAEGHGEGDDDGDAPDMAGLEAMMGGMGGGGGEGGAGGLDMNALMAMMGKGGGKGGGMDMASMMGGMGGMGGKGGKGGGKGGPPEDTDEKKGEKWVWMQKGEEVHIRFPLDPPAASKKDVSVTFKSGTLKVLIRGEAAIDGALGGKVDVDDCTWCLSPLKDELQVMLTKVEGKTEAWKDLLA